MNVRNLSCIHTGAIALLLSFAHGAVHAEDTTACAAPKSGLFAERIREEAARGMPSFVRFVKRTQTVYQLDLAAEIAKRDDERTACEARMAGTPLPIASDQATTRPE